MRNPTEGPVDEPQKPREVWSLVQGRDDEAQDGNLRAPERSRTFRSGSSCVLRRSALFCQCRLNDSASNERSFETHQALEKKLQLARERGHAPDKTSVAER